MNFSGITLRVRFSGFAIALAVASTLIIAETAFGNQASDSRNLDLDSSVCYMRTGDGKTIDLSRFCGSSNTVAMPNLVSRLLETRECSGCDLSRTNLSAAKLTGANLSQANLSGANLSRANLLGANLLGTDLRNANLQGAIMPDGSIHP